MNIENILVLAPHTDDGELGLGGTISKFIEEGKNVFYAAFSTADQSVPEGFPKDILATEVRNATFKLGIPPENLYIYHYEVRKLNYVRQELLEDMVKLRNERHYDLEAIRAFKKTTLLGYELIWNNLTFDTDCFVQLEERHIEAKCQALREYKSQEFRDYTSPEFVRSLARTRGVQVGCQYAESFEVIRLFL